MQRAVLGYTIIEVMIFLAISGLLFVSAVVAVGGQQAHTEFSSSMQDTNSKVQSWIDEVNNGFSDSSFSSSGNRKTSCGLDLINNTPVLANPGTEISRGSNSDCIFLGRTIQANTSSTNGYNRSLTSYTVLGRRLNGTDTVSNLAQANPAAAISPVDLTESFKLPSGTRIKKVTSNPSCGASACYMAAIYSSINSDVNTTKNGSEAINSLLYNLSDNVNPDTTAIGNCISFGIAAHTCNPPVNMNSWSVCFQSTRNSDTATLTINSTNGKGATTSLSFDAC